jgi:hypothetical protein
MAFTVPSFRTPCAAFPHQMSSITFGRFFSLIKELIRAEALCTTAHRFYENGR